MHAGCMQPGHSLDAVWMWYDAAWMQHGCSLDAAWMQHGCRVMQHCRRGQLPTPCPLCPPPTTPRPHAPHAWAQRPHGAPRPQRPTARTPQRPPAGGFVPLNGRGAVGPGAAPGAEPARHGQPRRPARPPELGVGLVAPLVVSAVLVQRAAAQEGSEVGKEHGVVQVVPELRERGTRRVMRRRWQRSAPPCHPKAPRGTTHLCKLRRRAVLQATAVQETAGERTVGGGSPKHRGRDGGGGQEGCEGHKERGGNGPERSMGGWGHGAGRNGSQLWGGLGGGVGKEGKALMAAQRGPLLPQQLPVTPQHRTHLESSVTSSMKPDSHLGHVYSWGRRRTG